MTDRPKAIVFDVDGVLVDSEPLHLWAWEQVMARYGIDVPEGDLDRFIGLPCTELLRDYQSRVGDRLPDAAWDEKQALFNDVMLTRLQPMPDAGTVMKALYRRGVPLAVASNSPSGRVKEMLAAIGVWSYVSAAAGIDEVETGKPAPDVYLLACRRLGVDPRQCLAVDDSPTGVAAAAAAGMTVWGYAHNFSEEVLREAGAQAVIQSLSEVLKI